MGCENNNNIPLLFSNNVTDTFSLVTQLSPVGRPLDIVIILHKTNIKKVYRPRPWTYIKIKKIYRYLYDTDKNTEIISKSIFELDMTALEVWSDISTVVVNNKNLVVKSVETNNCVFWELF